MSAIYRAYSRMVFRQQRSVTTQYGLKNAYFVVAVPLKIQAVGVIFKYKYRKTSSKSRTKSPHLNVSCLLLQSSLPNPLKPGVKLRMKM